MKSPIEEEEQKPGTQVVIQSSAPAGGRGGRKKDRGGRGASAARGKSEVDEYGEGVQLHTQQSTGRGRRSTKRSQQERGGGDDGASPQKQGDGASADGMQAPESTQIQVNSS